MARVPTAATLRANRRWIILGCAAVAAVSVPTPDPALMLVVMVLLFALCELGIMVKSRLERRPSPQPASEQQILTGLPEAAPLPSDDED